MAACAGAAGYLGYVLWDRTRPRMIESAGELPSGEKLMARDKQYVLDDEIGWRPRPNFEVTGEMSSIDGKVSATFRRVHDSHGWIEAAKVSEPVERPCAIVLGDSHTMGVVSNEENVSALLQKALRARPKTASARVVNVASGYYSLYQYSLRARQVARTLKPDAIVAIVFGGNDFHELEDPSRPHFGDDLTLEPPRASTTIQESLARLKKLNLPKRGSEISNQGLGQASYFFEKPERLKIVVGKMSKSLEALAGVAKEFQAELLLVYLPPYDLVAPEAVAAMSAEAKQVVASGMNQKLHDEFLGAAGYLKIPVVDLLPPFRESAGPYLYASDYHIWRGGHIRAADLTAPTLAELLEKRGEAPPR